MNFFLKLKYVFLLLLIFTSIMEAQITLTLPKLSGEVGKELMFPIKICDVTGMNVSAYQFQINYDQAIIQIYDTSVLGTLSNYSKTTNFVDTANGIIRIAWASPEPITGEGILLYLKIKILETGSAKIYYSERGKYPTGNVFNSMIGSRDYKIVTNVGTVVVKKKKNSTISE